MDPVLLLMLSSLMQMQNNIQSSSSFSMTDDNAPLFFFMVATALSHAAAIYTATTDPDNDDDKGNCENHSPPPNASISVYHNLFQEQAWAMDPQVRDTQWRSTYGVSYPIFARLLDQLRYHIDPQSIRIPLHSALAMVLCRLSQGCGTRTLASQYKVNPFMVAKITNMVTRILSTKLYSKWIRMPNGQRMLQNIQGFKDLTGLPNMCGAIDGSHIKIHKRPNNESIYKCRHNFYAILLQAVSDHRKIFWDVCVRAPGGTDDSTHFRESSLFNKLISGNVLMESVITIRGNHIRPYLVGDWSYPLLSFLLTPFSLNASGAHVQNVFDAALMRGMSSVEQAIGLLKGRWRILQDLNVDLSHAPQTVVACCVLHNMCQKAGEPEPPMWMDPRENGPVARPLESEKSFHYFGESLRQALLEDLQERHQRFSAR
ncbi:hypothetical protein SUGI_0807160 [Cryptomeria japonica]|nr:hypothetical protein SUGI_0807160 [Cryptomeria japonica]